MFRSTLFWNVAVMQARLKVLHDKANVKQVKLLPVTLIGRSTECNLKIASSQVSRAHCRITLGEDTVYVEDLGSANGTLINGKPLVPHQPTAVAPGATLVVGPAEFLIDYVASTSATMVLSRLSAPIAPSLSSTELLLPAKKDAPVPAGVPTASPPIPPVAVAPVAKPVTAAQTATPIIAAPVVATAVAVPAVAAEVARAVPVEAIPRAKPVLAQAAPVPMAFAPPPAAAPEAAPVEMTFAGFAPPTDEPVTDEASQFIFGEPAAFGDSPTSFADSPPASAADKKGGLKSLFSMFGRKAKGNVESSSLPKDLAADFAAPSVFLPTMDQIDATSSLADTDAEPRAFAFDEQPAAESTTPTVTFD
ncbi:MAG: FHA domain-containing protein, partial [Candidatus Saccharimonas sp.]|nr:FHA domain-containing protein [Planctomycetaceae bacterium]